MAQTDRRRGRPRPIETITRDEKALDALRGSPSGWMTRDSLARTLDVPHTKAYLVLYRLHRAGLVTRTRVGKSEYRWSITDPPAGTDGAASTA